MLKKKTKPKGLSWWFSGYESAFQCMGCQFDPWSGAKIQHATGQLSLHTTTAEPAGHN